MLVSRRALVALLPLLVLAACDDNSDVTGTSSNVATVRFLNATNTSINMSNAGTIASGNGSIGFGGSSTCTQVNTTGASGTGLSFLVDPTTNTIPGFTQSFTSGGSYTVVAYPSATGTTQFMTINNAGFTPNSGQAGLRIVNAAPTAGSLVVLGGGTALGTATGVSYGTSGSFMNVNTGSQAITFNTGTGTTTVANAGTLNFAAGQSYTLVVAAPATGSTTFRTFLVSGC